VESFSNDLLNGRKSDQAVKRELKTAAAQHLGITDLSEAEINIVLKARKNQLSGKFPDVYLIDYALSSLVNNR
jgi:hypothetical protein